LWPGQAVAACSGVRVMPPGPAVPIAAVASSVLDRPQPFLPEWLLSRWPAPSAATPAPIASALRVAVMLLYLVDPDSRQRRLSGPVREAGSAADRAHRSSVAHRGSLGGDNALGGGPGTVECPKWTDAAGTYIRPPGSTAWTRAGHCSLDGRLLRRASLRHARSCIATRVTRAGTQGTNVWCTFVCSAPFRSTRRIGRSIQDRGSNGSSWRSWRSR